MINAYQSDVKQLSDEELKTLSAEIAEVYQCTDPDGFSDWYLSDEARSAGERHDEMQAEVHRRWALANPVEAKRRDVAQSWFNEVESEMLASLAVILGKSRVHEGGGTA